MNSEAALEMVRAGEKGAFLLRPEMGGWASVQKETTGRTSLVARGSGRKGSGWCGMRLEHQQQSAGIFLARVRHLDSV